MSELNITKCKDCGKMKSRIFDGKFDNKNKRWNDETGSAWNGLRCPACHKIKQALLAKIRYHDSK